MFAEAGLPHATGIERVPNSAKALRLGELARERGRHTALHARLFDAYWHRALDIGDDAVLAAEGAEAGLDADEVAGVLGSDRYGDRVQAETTTLLEAGGTGVPAWVVDERVLIPGAQPHDVFERVLDRLGHQPLP